MIATIPFPTLGKCNAMRDTSPGRVAGRISRETPRSRRFAGLPRECGSEQCNLLGYILSSRSGAGECPCAERCNFRGCVGECPPPPDAA